MFRGQNGTIAKMGKMALASSYFGKKIYFETSEALFTESFV
jgi:hypothetical protein